MARGRAYNQFVSTLSVGLVDGPDATDIPDNAFYDMKGFNLDRNYPRSENGRQKVNSTEWVTGSRTLAVSYWAVPSGTRKLWTVTDGLLLETSGNRATVRNIVSDNVNAGTYTGSTVTPSSTNKAVGTLQVGDQFYFDADGYAERTTISAITAASFTVTGYGGGSDSGAYSIVRYLGGTTVDMLPAGGRLWVTDGTNKPHWYGDDGSGGNNIFREAGLPVPSTPPAVSIGAGGNLTAGTYFWEYAFEDAAGRLSNPVRMRSVVATTDQAATISAIPNAPSWVSKVRLYRSLADGDVAYSTSKDIFGLKGLSLATSSGDSVWTFRTETPDLTIDAQIARYVTFGATGNTYRIKDNTSTSVTLVGATAVATESATDQGKITGGYDYDAVVAANQVDVVPDSGLDLDHESPTSNDQPAAGLSRLHLFRGGGRLCAKDGTDSTKTWFSGREDTAAIRTGDNTNGEGELDYWPKWKKAGDQDDDNIQAYGSIGPKTVALKENSIWELNQEDNSVDNWFFHPVQGAENVGCLSPLSVANARGSLYWLGHESNGTDIIRFDGFTARGMLKSFSRRANGPTSRVTVDSIQTFAQATGGMFKGRYLLSYAQGTSPTNNSRTLDWDVKKRTLKIQPWACGVFGKSYDDSGTGTLPCCAPTDVSTLFKVMATAQDSGGNIARQLISKQFYTPQPRAHATLKMRVVNGNTLSSAPAVSYSVDGLPPEDTNKVWETTVTGDTWPTTVGETDLTYEIQAGERSHDICFKIASTDAKDWGVKTLRIEGSSYEQKSLGAT